MKFSSHFETLYLCNKTGLQPVSRPVEKVHYFKRWGWVFGSTSGTDIQTNEETGLAVCESEPQAQHIPIKFECPFGQTCSKNFRGKNHLEVK